ncbi:FAD-binding oxidoreductase [Chitinimonas sp. BJB300]|uniref:FAD-binding oxidoreductase n=1 Tax=Chitinimonas sp. BJB300 TaxID=1559339 RepID=UPI000C0D0390|nr:FAD-binding oxidoreductase [Chitinimonas sp. BJB300]PHV12554.1 hydroxyacid dehydrogenase [Chitinimonas sp. BJB300]TSJ90050.1 FAD-binding oxidoreductase [Chitinimonas sp. BJB300]
MPHALLAELANSLPAEALITSPTRLAPRLVDARKRLQGQTLALALPGSAEEAAQIIGRCHAHGVSVVPQAGNTSLVGGATPMSPTSLLLGCDRLKQVRYIDPTGYTLTAEAGCILDDIRAVAEVAGRLFPLWLGSSGSARLGGLIGTNAGGLQVQRYGNTRELVLGIEAVLPDGSIFKGLHPLRKRNAGYDLKQLFIGAEGTLGFVTAATLRLFPLERGAAVAMVALDDAEQVLALFAEAKANLGEVLTAFEMIDRESLNLMAHHHSTIAQPFDVPPPFAVLIALSGGETDAVLMERLTECLLANGYEDAALAQDGSQAKALWALREHIPSAQTRQGPSIKHDLALPISAIPAFVAEAATLLAQRLPAAKPVVFGHVGDGNLHYNLSLPVSEDFATSEALANQLLFDLVARHGGDISAEHGIGRLRIAAADAGHDPVERALMRQIKASLDPDGFFNPGVLL